VRPRPGAHPLEFGLPLGIALRDMLGKAQTTTEVKNLLNFTECKVDGKRRKDHRFIIGLMDVLQVGADNYRMIINTKSKLQLTEEKNPGQKPCAIKGKCIVKGKIQLNLHDGSNMLTDDKKYKVGDTLLLGLPKKEIKGHLPLKEGAFVYLTGGGHVGETGIIEHLSGNVIVVKTKKATFETHKRYAFIIMSEEL